MRFISMHKTNPRAEAGELPHPELMAGMGPLVDRLVRDGVFIGAEGLQPSFTGVRLRFDAAGRRQITPGPFVGGNELPAAFCVLKVRNLDEAVLWATRLAEQAGFDAIGEIDIRPITEPWHLGCGPRPDDGAGQRFMLMRKADAASEAGARPDASLRARLAALQQEMIAAGVFLAAELLQPSARGVRLQFAGGERRVIDGPFAESKELIAGYCILDVPNLDAAVALAGPFAQLIGDVEIDVRPLLEESELVQ
jgi:hypothetical protein